MNGRILRIDTTRLSQLEAVRTGVEPGHHSIRPRDAAGMPGWMDSRDDEPPVEAAWHPLTRELYESVVDTDLLEAF